jgi:hypothetical protein
MDLLTEKHLPHASRACRIIFVVYPRAHAGGYFLSPLRGSLSCPVSMIKG